MTQKVVCDGCGAEDDWSLERRAFFVDGGTLLVREGNGSEFGTSYDLCGRCVARIIEALPQLAENSEV